MDLGELMVGYHKLNQVMVSILVVVSQMCFVAGTNQCNPWHLVCRH